MSTSSPKRKKSMSNREKRLWGAIAFLSGMQLATLAITGYFYLAAPDSAGITQADHEAVKKDIRTLRREWKESTYVTEDIPETRMETAKFKGKTEGRLTVLEIKLKSLEEKDVILRDSFTNVTEMIAHQIDRLGKKSSINNAAVAMLYRRIGWPVLYGSTIESLTDDLSEEEAKDLNILATVDPMDDGDSLVDGFKVLVGLVGDVIDVNLEDRDQKANDLNQLFK